MSDTSLLVPDWNALEPPQAQAAAAPPTPRAPDVGTIMNGYRFTGGDPADQKSWAKIEAPKKGDVIQGYRFEGGDPSSQDNWHKLVDYDAKDVPLAAVENFFPSLGKRLGEMWEGAKNTVEHPLDTAATIGKLGVSILPGMESALHLASAASRDFLPPDIADKVRGGVQDILAPKEALIKDYVDTYGGWENIKRTLAEDPTRPIFDALSFVAPESRAGKILGLAVDPVTQGSKIGRFARQGAGFATDELAGRGAGTGPAALREAYDAGRAGGTNQLDWKTAFEGGMNTDDIVSLAKQGVRNMRDAMLARFKADKPLWASKSQLPSQAFDDINKAEKNALQSVFKIDNSGNMYSMLSEADQRKLFDISEIVNEWRANPSRHNIEDLDNLKQRIRNEINWREDNPNFKRVVTNITNGVTDTIKKYAPPEYSDAMGRYAKASKMVDEVENSFGLGGSKEKAAATILGKLQKVLRNDVTTQYGQHAKDMERLQTLGGVNPMPSLSGAMLNTWGPRGLSASNMHTGMGLTALGSLAAAPFTGGASLIALPPALASYVAGMPRLWGHVYNKAGRLAGLGDRAVDAVPKPIRSGLSTLADPRIRRGALRTYGDLFPQDDEEAQ